MTDWWIGPLILYEIENISQFEDFYVPTDRMSLHVWLDAGVEGHVFHGFICDGVTIAMLEGRNLFVDNFS